MSVANKEKKMKSVSEWKNMTMQEQKEYLITKIQNAIGLDIHNNVCYLLNFCGLPQKTATELAKHYNAIDEIIEDFKNQK